VATIILAILLLLVVAVLVGLIYSSKNKKRNQVAAMYAVDTKKAADTNSKQPGL